MLFGHRRSYLSSPNSHKVIFTTIIRCSRPFRHRFQYTRVKCFEKLWLPFYKVQTECRFEIRTEPAQMNRISLLLVTTRVTVEGIKWWGGFKGACVLLRKEEALLRWKLASFIACLVRQARSWAQKASYFRHANKWRFDKSYGEYTEVTYRPLPLETLACLRGILKAVQTEQTIQQSLDKSQGTHTRNQNIPPLESRKPTQCD